MLTIILVYFQLSFRKSKMKIVNMKSSNHYKSEESRFNFIFKHIV